MTRAKSPMKRSSSFPVTAAIAFAILYGTPAGGATVLPGAEVKAAPVAVPAYHYNPVKKPDPFRSFLDREAEAKKKMRAKIRPGALSPLQVADISQYKLRGIAGDEQNRSAIVEDAGGKFYPVFLGTVIGQHNGKVVAIFTDRVIVEETVKAGRGQSKVNRIPIKLYKVY